jgi:predicted aconitase
MSATGGSTTLKAMRLTAEERAMLAGAEGPVVRQALEYQCRVGDFLGAVEFVPIASAHVMAEMECMGAAGLEYVRRLGEQGGRFRVPTTTNPRSVDAERWQRLGQDEAYVRTEIELSAALERLGAILADTCINYQTIVQPIRGQHLAWGDTGTVIYANAVAGARTNYEGGPAAIAAAITGRTPAYGFHLDAHRRGTLLVRVRARLGENADWGALGGIVGRAAPGYRRVPVIDGIADSPTADQLKHLGAALASYGSHAMYHLVGVTPEAPSVEAAFGGRAPPRTIDVDQGDLEAFYASFVPERQSVDLVVFSAPQLSLFELRDLAHGLRGRRVADGTRLLVTTSYHNRDLAEWLGYLEAIEAAGGLVLAGACYYLMTPRELAEKFGLRDLFTNSAKLANIIAGYGYNPVFRRTEECLAAALTGRAR